MNVKIFGRCFSVALCTWSLILSSFAFTASAQTTNEKPLTAAECTSGPDSPYQWNAELNRCMLKADSTGMRELLEDCDALESADAKKSCYERLRNQALNNDGMNSCKAQHGEDPEAMKECMKNIKDRGTGMDDEFEEESTLDALGLTVDTAATVYAAAILISETKFSDLCTSAKMASLVGVGALVAHTMLKSGSKGDFDKIEKNYNDQVAAADNAQLAAYDYLIAQQNEIKSIADKHVSRYKLITLGYTAAAVVATLELTVGSATTLTPCTDAISSGVILATTSAGALLYLSLMNKAKEEKEQAAENAKLVTNLKTKIEESLNSSSYCSSRDDLTRPRCYCYSSDGKRNPERTRSETCQALWANHDRNLFAEAGDYGKDKEAKAVGCYTLDRKWDPNCKCRNLKNDKGQNACYQAPIGVNEIAAISPATGIPNVIDSFNQMFNGGFATGELRPGNIDKLAAAVNRARKTTMDSLNKKMPDGKKYPLNQQMQSILKDLKKKITPASLAAAKSDAGILANSAPGLSNNPAIKEAIQKSGITVGSIPRRGVVKSNKKAAKKVGFDLYGKEEKKETAEFMEKKYDYTQTQNDIVEREDVSIWQVISNRYTVTGLRRLFDDDPDEL